MSINLTLDRIRPLASHLQPPYTRPTIHVAGTNGKGSVTSIVASILRASGFSVGRFNSPHLVSIYDSILIDDRSVTPEAYNRASALVVGADLKLGTQASSFELLTLTALQVFETAKVDIAVIEVGMGGLHDATNVITDECILVSALTAVDLDHQTFLGSTVESITQNKAGIARKGKPFLLGAQKHSAVEVAAKSVVDSIGGYFFVSTQVQKRPVENESRFSLSAQPFVPPPGQPIRFESPAFPPVQATLPLHGAHQLHNLALSLTIISTLLTHPSCQKALRGLRPPEVTNGLVITSDTIRTGIEAVSWPGRLSFHKLPCSVTNGLSRDPLTVLVDGAHNPASSETLASYISDITGMLKPRPPKLHITYVLGLSHSPPKTPLETLSPFLSRHSHADPLVTVRVAVLRFTPPEGMPWVKSVEPSTIRDTVLQIVSPADVDVWSAPDEGPIDGQLQNALEWTEAGQAECEVEEEKLVVLAGSLYLVADFYRLLKQLERSGGAV
ncbi:hypothetical protein HYDPIDRAFT_182668 [Hydnomerulius pinastri MD-312]|uniref:Mur ligase central domain-containing protein n=1 Tax=Hydnomerulius pinastri MD-312 TaxID=994086 RepID=A0A0C9WDM7_9AGAM|nr:hypothetical protein HYDPIDRAFT_182668 [Hydnomerulius pinastri MD-312]